MTHTGPNREIFGQVNEGEDAGQSVYRLQLTGGGLRANILTWGATVQDLRLEGHDHPLVLGFDNFAAYETHGLYFGATVGRFANRLNKGAFSIDGQTFQTDKNDGNYHTLHGGRQGYSNRNWKIADLGTSHVYLTLEDKGGFMGFPGTCHATCCYTLQDNGILHIAHTTRTTAATPAGMAHHSYFNLDGSSDCRNHILQILAHAYLPVDASCIPTGDIAPLHATAFDFNSEKRIGDDPVQAGNYDHNFCLAERRRGKQNVAVLKSDRSNIQMTVATTEPGLQFYTGVGVETQQNGLLGKPYGPYGGLCLETQNWPDAPNNPDFPDAILQPGETMRQVTEYRFLHLRHA